MAAIARHFDTSQQGGRMAGDYLEKIIQIPVTVPALGQGDTEAYLAMMLLDQHLDGDEDALRTIALHCAERMGSRHYCNAKIEIAVETTGVGTDLPYINGCADSDNPGLVSYSTGIYDASHGINLAATAVRIL